MNGVNGPWVTQDQWMGLLRQLIPVMAGIAIGKGWLTMEQAGEMSALLLQIAGPVGVVGAAIWAYIANSKKSILLSAGRMPEVAKVVVADPTLAAVPSDKVVNGKDATVVLKPQ